MSPTQLYFWLNFFRVRADRLLCLFARWTSASVLVLSVHLIALTLVLSSCVFFLRGEEGRVLTGS